MTADGWNADVKDELEAILARQVCSGRVPLAEAQRAIAADWTAAYNRFVIGEEEFSGPQTLSTRSRR